MKKLLLYSLGALFFMASCTKNENPKLPDLAQVPPPLITVDSTSDPLILDPAAFVGKVDISLYYPDGPKPKKFDIVIVKDGDPTTEKVLLADLTTFSKSLTITGPQLTALFGTIVPGNSFSIGANITTQDGKVYPAFPGAGATAFPAADYAAPGFSPVVTFNASCPFVMTDYGTIGSTAPFNVITDDWDPGIPATVPATVPVTIIDATHLSFKFGPGQGTVVVTINPHDNTVSIAKTDIGDYGDALPYGDVTMNPSTSTQNAVTPCNLSLSIYPEFTVSAGSFGNYQIAIQKPAK